MCQFTRHSQILWWGIVWDIPAWTLQVGTSFYRAPELLLGDRDMERQLIHGRLGSFSQNCWPESHFFRDKEILNNWASLHIC
jgi:hypothetical protein